MNRRRFLLSLGIIAAAAVARTPLPVPRRVRSAATGRLKEYCVILRRGSPMLLYPPFDISDAVKRRILELEEQHPGINRKKVFMRAVMEEAEEQLRHEGE